MKQDGRGGKLTQKDPVVEVLEKLVSDIPGMTGNMVVGRDGVVIRANVPANLGVDDLAAMTTSMVALADVLLASAAGGSLDRLRVVGTQGQVLGVPIADDVSLIMFARRSIDPDMAFENAGRAALQMAQFL